jgi:integrase/recombinase XerC
MDLFFVCLPSKPPDLHFTRYGPEVTLVGMAHKPKPRYKSGKYVVVIPGRSPGDKPRQVHLFGPCDRNPQNEAEAWAAYYRVMAVKEDAVPKKITVELACDLFLDYAKKNVQANTWDGYHGKLKDFAGCFKGMKVTTLRSHHITDWVKSHANWGNSTARNAIGAVKIAMAWCVREGYIEKDPARPVRRPSQTRRTRTLTPEERQEIRAFFDDTFGDYLDALTWTGARPGEIVRLEARHINWESGVASFPGKTTRATGKPIILVLIHPMLELCRRLAAQNPEGPLFRNHKGDPWTVSSVAARMTRLRERMPIDGVSAYTYRHSFVTDALEQGVPVTDVAELVNHANVQSTMVYNHISQRTEHLRRQAAKALGYVTDT